MVFNMNFATQPIKRPVAGANILPIPCKDPEIV